MPDAPPLLADRYRLGVSLGRGGMGEVRLARDEVLQRDVAIKAIDPPPGAEDDAAARRTLREARAAARLNHPAVVQVYDVLEVEGRTWIVMEYVPSRSLRQAIADDGPLPIERAARIGLDLLGALQAAHRAGVQHRDVKPANVLLADDGRVLLTDFGIAAVDDDGVISRSDVVVGSPQFMAPERAKTGVAGAEADLWSLGATLYAAVEGHAPFERTSTMATLTALTTEEVPPAENAGALQPVIDALLVKDPARRLGAEDAEARLRLVIADLSEDSGGSAWIPRQRLGPKGAEKTSGSRGSGLIASAMAGLGLGAAQKADKAAAKAEQAAAKAGQAQAEAKADQAQAEARAEQAAAKVDHAAAKADPAAGEPGKAEAPKPETSESAEALAAPPAPAVTEAKAAEPAVVEDDPVGPAEPGESAGRAAVPAGAGAVVAGGNGRRRLLIGAVVLLVLVATGVAWLVSSRDQEDPQAESPRPASSAATVESAPAGAPGSQPAPNQAAPTGPAASASGAPSSSAPAGSGPASSAPASSAAPDGLPPLPAGWMHYKDKTGFSVYVPKGWKRTRENTMVYFRGDGRVLGIDQTDKPKSNPVADWQSQRDYRRADGDFPQYDEVKIEAVDYFRKAADWEFTFTRNGRQHVNNRGAVISDMKAYGFYWQTSDAEWDDARDDLQLVFDSFRPAK